MTQWLKSGTRRACIFVRHACISGVLIAVLAGCNGSDGAQTSQSTFEVVQAEPGPVIGTVTEVETTKHPPVTEGGNAINLPVIEKATRFTEVAPETIGGATYQASAATDYELGNLVAKSSEDSSTFSGGTIFIAPIKGWVRYPEKAVSLLATATRYPLIVFMHGNHTTDVSNYKGYDYLAEDLAEHGYAVFSIDANANNDAPDWDDESSQSRAQLLLGTLDRLRQIDGFGQVDNDGNPGPLDVLKDKLDFTRVGIMGHSRGGQGVSNAILFNKVRRGVSEADLKGALQVRHDDFSRAFPDLAAAVTPATVAVPATETTPEIAAKPAGIDEGKFQKSVSEYNIFYAAGNDEGVPRYDFKGAFMLAPTDFAGITGLNHVPLANLLPSCDGDVSNLQGAWAYDHNRFGPEDDTAPRYQIMVRGANHNFYNTIWTGRDRIIDYCKQNRLTYMTPKEQRRGGLFIMNSFMRYHVGGEEKFAAYWNGTAQLPAAACPGGKGPCDERVVLTVQKNGGGAGLIQGFDGDGTTKDEQGNIKPDSMKFNALGGAVTFSGFDEDGQARCGMASGGYSTFSCIPKQLDDFDAIMSKADHVELAWSEPNAAIVSDLAGVSAVGYDSLTFRIAVVNPVGQEVMVTLTDSAGHAATVTASDFSDALYNVPRPKGDGRPMVDHPDDELLVGDRVSTLLLNMVAIPLKAFDGVDMTSLKELKLVFPKGSGDKESGKVAITDIELQNLGREKPVQQVAWQ